MRPDGALPTDSVLEDETLAFLESRGLPRPEDQLPVWVGDRRYDADLGWPAERVIIECDGWENHATPTARSRDNVRRDELQAEGWVVLTVTWISLRDHPDRLESTIRKVLARRPNEAAA